MSARVGALCHHFSDIEQQRGAERLGMWMFLATEVLFFGGVFFAYTVYRLWYPYDFAAISSELNVLIAGINTFVLLTSSLTMTLAIRAAQQGKRQALLFNLAATALLGTAFMGFKTYEYMEDVHENLVPWSKDHFNPHQWEHEFPEHHKDDPNFAHFKDSSGHLPPVSPQRVRLFLTFYYVMTGIHGVHLIIGIGVVTYLLIRAYFRDLTPDKYVAVECTSLYWHLVDAIWLFLMPLLYLAGPHSLKQLHF